MRGEPAAIQGGVRMRVRWLPRDSKLGLSARAAIVGTVAWAILPLGIMAITGVAHAQPAHERAPRTTLLDAALADAAFSDRLAVQSQSSAALDIAAAAPITPNAHGLDKRWLWVSLTVAPLLLPVFLWLRDRCLSPKVSTFINTERSRS